MISQANPLSLAEKIEKHTSLHYNEGYFYSFSVACHENVEKGAFRKKMRALLLQRDYRIAIHYKLRYYIFFLKQ